AGGEQKHHLYVHTWIVAVCGLHAINAALGICFAPNRQVDLLLVTTRSMVDSSHLGPVHQGIQHAIGYASNSSNNESAWRAAWSTTFFLFHTFSIRLGAALDCQTIPEFLALRRGGLINPLAPLERTMPFPSARPIFRPDPDDNSQSQLPSASSSGDEYTDSGGQPDSQSQLWNVDLDLEAGYVDHNLRSKTANPLGAPLGASLSSSSSEALSVSGSRDNTPELPSDTPPLGPAAPASRAGSERISNELDERRYFDLALVIFRSIPGDSWNVHGRIIWPQEFYPAILLEAKSPPPRLTDLPALVSLSPNPALANSIEEAYDDFSKKLPGAFATFPQQQSVVALATSGAWWSFAVVNRDDECIRWSRLFTLGYIYHDPFLLSLFHGASMSPNNPRNHSLVQAMVTMHINQGDNVVGSSPQSQQQ
ncbi:unnamed protein product, partial [Rhizoctonia solani]